MKYIEPENHPVNILTVYAGMMVTGAATALEHYEALIVTRLVQILHDGSIGHSA